MTPTPLRFGSLIVLSLVACGPIQADLTATTDQPQTPLLVGVPDAPMLLVTLKTDRRVAVRRITLSLDEPATRAVKAVRIYHTDEADPWDSRATHRRPASAVAFGTPVIGPGAKVTIDGEADIEPGERRFWVAVKLRDDADLDATLDGAVESVELSDGRVIAVEPEAGGVRQRVGIALRNAGDDGAAVYRIPGLVTSNAGTLLAVYDIRHRGWGDLPGDIDVGLSRSADGGRTWEPMRTIMDMGDPEGNDPEWRADGVGDPAVLVDRQTNTIWVAATWSHGNRSWVGSGPGLEPDETGQLMLVRSDDDGRTWSKPINITRQVKDPAWCFVLQGPGRGITMADGTLVFAAQYQDTPANKRLPYSTIFYSKDRGQTWAIGTGAFPDTTEAQVTETEPGVLMLNCRYNRQNRRVVMITRDLGATWTEHPTSRKDLAEPGACMASLINLDLPDRAGRWLAFSNPNVDAPPRRHMTIRLSPDAGSTWPEPYRLLLDAAPSAGYSCLTQIDRDTLGILYEGSRSQLTFQRVRIADLMRDAKD